MVTHCVVPDGFGAGVICPLVKDKLGNINDVNNYRGITLISVISKLFEYVLLEIFTFLQWYIYTYSFFNSGDLWHLFLNITLDSRGHCKRLKYFVNFRAEAMG